jgi:hypothetical protein
LFQRFVRNEHRQRPHSLFSRVNSYETDSCGVTNADRDPLSYFGWRNCLTALSIKTATDGTKRALATFGKPFGLALYGNGKTGPSPRISASNHLFKCIQPDLRPAWRTTLPHLSVSDAMNLPKSAAVPGAG